MPSLPPQPAVESINSGLSRVIRRIEIAESDGTTLWTGEEDEIADRLVAGTVSVDYGREERRTVDTTLRNDDNALRPDPYDGIWYDKVIKCYRGVRYSSVNWRPKTVIITDASIAQNVRGDLIRQGYTEVDMRFTATSFAAVGDYDFIIAISGANPLPTDKLDVLIEAWNAGKMVMSITTDPTTSYPWITSVAAVSTTINHGHVPGDIPVQKLWSPYNSTGSISGNLITGVTSEGVIIAQMTAGATTGGTAALAIGSRGGRWIHYSANQAFRANANGLLFLSAVLPWVEQRNEMGEWETQIGEFVIDNFSWDNFPYHMKIVGRDYTKRCLTSKLERAKSFEAGTSATELIRALAANAGIRKFKLPDLNINLESRLDYAMETPRWNIMKEIANAFQYDVFFDTEGYLTMEQFGDPVFSPSTVELTTGEPAGNLVKLSTSVTDSELYNHIVVTSGSESSDQGIPYFGEAINNEPGSPTAVDRIGDRPYFWSSVALESDEQCKELARSWLGIYALESYDINAEHIVYPWLEVGNIADIKDPKRRGHEPTRYLMSTLNIPLNLAPMSMQARRLVIVQDTAA